MEKTQVPVVVDAWPGVARVVSRLALPGAFLRPPALLEFAIPFDKDGSFTSLSRRTSALRSTGYSVLRTVYRVQAAGISRETGQRAAPGRAGNAGELGEVLDTPARTDYR